MDCWFHQTKPSVVAQLSVGSNISQRGCSTRRRIVAHRRVPLVAPSSAACSSSGRRLQLPAFPVAAPPSSGCSSRRGRLQLPAWPVEPLHRLPSVVDPGARGAMGREEVEADSWSYEEKRGNRLVGEGERVARGIRRSGGLVGARIRRRKREGRRRGGRGTSEMTRPVWMGGAGDKNVMWCVWYNGWGHVVCVRLLCVCTRRAAGPAQSSAGLPAPNISHGQMPKCMYTHYILADSSPAELTHLLTPRCRPP